MGAVGDAVIIRGCGWKLTAEKPPTAEAAVDVCRLTEITAMARIIDSRKSRANLNLFIALQMEQEGGQAQ